MIDKKKNKEERKGCEKRWSFWRESYWTKREKEGERGEAWEELDRRKSIETEVKKRRGKG